MKVLLWQRYLRILRTGATVSLLCNPRCCNNIFALRCEVTRMGHIGDAQVDDTTMNIHGHVIPG